MAFPNSKGLFALFEEAYTKEAEERGPVEIAFALDEGEEKANGEAEHDKRTNIFDIGRKLPVNKPKMLGLRNFKQAKIGKKRFDNEPPSKESVEFQEQVMDEVVKGHQMRLFEINPAFPRRSMKFMKKQWH